MSLFNNKKALVASIVLILAIIIVVLLRSSSLNSYITVDEFSGQADSGRVRIAGQIVNNSYKWVQAENALHFSIEGPAARKHIAVVYKGLPPENLVPDSKVVVEGSLYGKTFRADTVLVRCPENYLPETALGGLARAMRFEGTLYR